MLKLNPCRHLQKTDTISYHVEAAKKQSDDLWTVILPPGVSEQNNQMNKIKPIAVFDQTFERIVLKSPIPVIVDFWASWCVPCQILTPLLEKLAVEYEGRLLIVNR